MSIRILSGYQNVYWLAIAAIFLSLSGRTMAEDDCCPLVSAGVETETNSRYLWRGLIFSDGAVQQSTLWVTITDVTASVWFNHDIKSRSVNWGLNEIDLSLAYSTSLKNLEIEPSLNYFGYPYQDESPGTAEIGLKVGYPVSLIEIFTNHTLDIKEYPRAYYGEVGIAYQVSPSERSSLEISATFGWASTQFAMAYTGEAPDQFQLASLIAGIDYYFSTRFYARPHIAYSSILTKAYETVTGSRDHWQLGLAIGAEF